MIILKLKNSDNLEVRVAVCDRALNSKSKETYFSKTKTLVTNCSSPVNFFIVDAFNSFKYHFIKQYKDKPTEITTRILTEEEARKTNNKTLLFENGDWYIKLKSYNVRCQSFFEVDDNNNVIYPFVPYYICFPSTDADVIKLRKKEVNNIIPIEILSLNSVKDTIKKETGVSIVPLINSLQQISSYSSISGKDVDNYIKFYNQFPTFKKCCDIGTNEISLWVTLSVKTMAKKMQEIDNILKDIVIDDIPDYVKYLLKTEFFQNISKNILFFYKIGFNEQDFKDFKRIFKSFGQSSCTRFMLIYNLCERFDSGKYSVADILSIIQKNISLEQNSSVRAVFQNVKKFISAEKLIPMLGSDFVKRVYTAFITSGLTVNLCNSFEQEIITNNKSMFYNQFTHYPNLIYNNNQLVRITKFEQLPSYIKQGFWRCQDFSCLYPLNYPDVFEPNESEILFLYNDYCYDELLLVKVNLKMRTFDVFYNGKNITSKCTNTTISYLSNIFNDHIFPTYINMTINEIF